MTPREEKLRKDAERMAREIVAIGCAEMRKNPRGMTWRRWQDKDDDYKERAIAICLEYLRRKRK